MQISAGDPTLEVEELLAVQRVMASGRLTQGAEVAQFEEAFARRLGVPYAVAVCNGTAALHLALATLHIGPGDEVIVPATTFVATANAVAYTGAQVVVADVNRRTWCLDVGELNRWVTPRTKAIVPVHVYGAMADIQAITDFASARGILVVEDAAEALGAGQPGAWAGSLSTLGCYSFFGNKTITTGEGGMVVTRSEQWRDRLRLLRGQGQTPGKRYWHDVLGYNYRMTELQAAIGSAQLERLDDLLAARQRVAAQYRELLAGLVGFQQTTLGNLHGNWAVAVRLPREAEAVGKALEARGIETRPVFPPMHVLPMYRDRNSRLQSEELWKYGLVLPTHAKLTSNDVQYVCDSLIEVLAYGS